MVVVPGSDGPVGEEVGAVVAEVDVLLGGRQANGAGQGGDHFAVTEGGT